MNQTWENGEKYNFRPNIGLFDPYLDLQNFFLKFTSGSAETLFQVAILSNFNEK